MMRKSLFAECYANSDTLKAKILSRRQNTYARAHLLFLDCYLMRAKYSRFYYISFPRHLLQSFYA